MKMSESQFSLSCNSYQSNICSGLSALQQNGEFVDMTLAADGYYVKVHQLVMSLASPYIKDIIKSTHCTHPIVFLNQISYKTLCLLLEYIYSGEVIVQKEDIEELLTAAKALHIRGLDDMNLSNTVLMKSASCLKSLNETTARTLEKSSNKPLHKNEESLVPVFDISVDNDDSGKYEETIVLDPIKIPTPGSTLKKATLQYTVSSYGNVMLLLNRFIYRSRYIGRGGRFRRWQCISYKSTKCKATIITSADNVVPKRCYAHNHAFHDKQILRKVQQGMVFDAIKHAEEKIKDVKNAHIQTSDT